MSRSPTDAIFFNSGRRIGVILPDGSREGYPTFATPPQALWQVSFIFPDGRHAMLWSQEPPKNPAAAFADPDGPAFAPTHLWRYDFVTGALAELLLPTHSTLVGLLPGGGEWLVLGNADGAATLDAVSLDGRGGECLYRSPGFAYGAAPSPDGGRVAFHVVGAGEGRGYEIVVVDLGRHEATRVAGDPAWLYFGPTWSPDGRWLLYQRCDHQNDPGHDRSDLCLSRPDGSDHRMLTHGQSHWFAAAHGTPERHASGSNAPAWSPDGRRIAASLLWPGSRTAWPYRVGRPDLDHFNRDYRPDEARGGARLCLIDPATGTFTPLLAEESPSWCFGPSWSPDGATLAFARADAGQQAELCVADVRTRRARPLTRGLGGRGAAHFRWARLTPDTVEALLA